MATPILTPILKPIYLVDTIGEFAVMPDGSTINIGGVSGPSFLVNNKPLLFADGTATDGSPVSNQTVDFQTAYTNSVGEAFVDFTSGKDLVYQAINGKQFRFDADTGLVTITGNLYVQGTTTTTIESAVNSDRVAIRQTAGDYIPFLIEPRVGVNPVMPIASISVTNGGAPVFQIAASGVTTIDNLIVPGTINGVNITALQQQLTNHVAADNLVKHAANQISVDPTNLAPITGTTVQAALESVASSLSTIATGVVKAYEHVQQSANHIWTITHGQNSRRVQISLWDSFDELIFADTVAITDANTVIITYNSAITGRAILMLF